MQVRLTYFKESGKYYTLGEFPMDPCPFHIMVDRVRAAHDRGTLPGLEDGAGRDMFVLIEGGPNDVPHLLWPVVGPRCDRCGAEGSEERKLNGMSVGVLCRSCWRATIAGALEEASSR